MTGGWRHSSDQFHAPRKALLRMHLVHKFIKLILVHICQAATRGEVQGFMYRCCRTVDVTLQGRHKFPVSDLPVVLHDNRWLSDYCSPAEDVVSQGWTGEVILCHIGATAIHLLDVATDPGKRSLCLVMSFDLDIAFDDARCTMAGACQIQLARIKQMLALCKRITILQQAQQQQQQGKEA